MESVFSFFSEYTLNGFSLWVIALLCVGVFLASFMDAIAGGGGIISVPVYLMTFGSIPTYFVLGTNKFSAGIGTIFSTARFVRKGFVDWSLCVPAAALSMLGSVGGTWLQHHTPDAVLKYLLLFILPIIAVVTLRGHSWPDEVAETIPLIRKRLIVCVAALLIGCYDGYYGPGTGTFLMLVFVRLARMDTRHAAGCAKVINLASNIGGICSALAAGYVFLGVGAVAAIFSVLGHWLGAGLAIKNGSRLVRPTVVIVLLLLTAKILSELLFPSFWN